jgi:hypothetical protein
MSWIDITKELTAEGRKLPVGQILMFDKVDLKIMRKYKGKVWAKRVHLMTPEQADNEVEIVQKT